MLLALSACAEAKVNFRVLPGETMASVAERVKGIVGPGVNVKAARLGVGKYEGRYLTFRLSLDGAPTIRSFLTEIAWDENDECLAFKETQ